MLSMLPPPALEALSWTLPCCAFFHIGSKVLCLLTVANPNIAFQCARLSFTMGLAGEASHFCTFRSKVSPARIDRWPSKAFVQHVSKTSIEKREMDDCGRLQSSVISCFLGRNPSPRNQISLFTVVFRCGFQPENPHRTAILNTAPESIQAIPFLPSFSSHSAIRSSSLVQFRGAGQTQCSVVSIHHDSSACLKNMLENSITSLWCRVVLPKLLNNR